MSFLSKLRAFFGSPKPAETKKNNLCVYCGKQVRRRDDHTRWKTKVIHDGCLTGYLNKLGKKERKLT